MLATTYFEDRNQISQILELSQRTDVKVETLTLSCTMMKNGQKHF